MNATPTPNDDPTARLDAQALARLHALDPDGRHGVVARVLATFESSLLRQLAQLDEARERGDAGEIGRVAHTLKSSSASIGALALSAVCAEVEQAVRAGETAELVKDVDRLLAEGRGALVAVRAILHP
jgi:HPt (histidine-containing phosphotransfer) domain-containing protein